MTTQISTDTKVSDLLAKVMPDLTKEALAKTNAANEFGGTELSLMVEASQSTYGYILKDGKDVDVVEGAIDNPTVLLKVSEDDIQKMITNQELDMLLSLTTDLTKSKYDCVKGLNGGFNAKLANTDGSSYDIVVLFNGAQAPKATIKMKTEDSTALMRKEINPMNLFMSGGMQIEGDMAFALAVQPLFS